MWLTENREAHAYSRVRHEDFRWALNDRKSDPQDHTDWSTDYMPYKTYCYCTTRGIDQIQASLKKLF